jgi:3-deoxy-D-manno-octulosonate 8-phosphate phosphatase KdsC-like HAD superfamily phosphatase
MILTEDRSEAVERRAAALGISAFAGKPLSAPRLGEKFDQLLERG